MRKEEDRTILEQIKSNTKRFVDIFYEIVEKNLPDKNQKINPEDVLSRLYRNVGTNLRTLWRSKGRRI